ncbi:acetoin dehydrogenase [Halarcobacter ebronensis]|uniref:Acetoin dehydrogenase n=1 Tax=Halarcobacter ebronensis TaxID=1462615 RepID=A0A4Q0YCL2_9BACT|nr:thiamine pyrophosphate-dependent dehydrogenase E1 component subunit alpha [Halarcobacter ebronensis]RXJ66621.1 acetoin dehydrogenase [Halarcobacter ebronensis]
MNINIDELKQIYLRAYKIRKTEEEIANRYSEQEMRCPTHLSIGQELVPSIYAQFITKEDYAVSTHRAHAHYLAKGGDLKAMIAEIYGKKTGCSHGMGGSMHLIDKKVGFMGSTAIVGGTIPIGVGLALSIQIKNENRISTVFLGDGSTEEGVFYESINFAALKDLPVIFICENNFYSVYSKLEVRQPKNRKIYKFVEAMGIKTLHADGYNIEEAYNKIKEAISYVKEKRKPILIELDTYRFREHCGPNFDNDIGYREEEEYKYFLSKDPLIALRTYLEENNVIDTVIASEQKIETEIKEAFTFAKESPWPKYNEISNYLYKESL